MAGIRARVKEDMWFVEEYHDQGYLRKDEVDDIAWIVIEKDTLGVWEEEDDGEGYFTSDDGMQCYMPEAFLDFENLESRCEKWHNGYDALGFDATWKEGDALIDMMNEVELEEFVESHEKVNKWTGLDARQKHMMICAKVKLEGLREQR